MKRRTTKQFGNQVMVEGMMAFGKLENGLRTLDFECCEEVEAESFTGKFKVQGMRDGNLYMTEMKKPVHNKPLYRDDNASLTLGRNGQYYFVFMMPEFLVNELPRELVRQANAIAQKVFNDLIQNN